MKTLIIIIALSLAGIAGLAAQTANPTPASATQGASLPAPTAWQMANHDANSRVWQRTVYERGPGGHVLPRTHQYTELATGMYYQDASGQWQESQDEIDAYAQGAISQKGPYQVIYANNLNTAGSIDQQTPDGKRLRSNILGLVYHDTASGEDVLIGQVQDSTGQLISANQVLYTNAFSGVKADVRYTYKKGSFEQDVILRAQLPTPESVGLSSATTEIEVMTEFLNPPQEAIIEHPGGNGSEPDQDVSWGAMRIGHGKAFDLGEPSNRPSRISVTKQYTTVQGRKILLEKVPLSVIQSSLQSLPLHAAIKSKRLKTASKELQLPKPLLAQATGKPMKLAVSSPASQGYVLDYMELNTDQTNFTFRADTTYYISAAVYISGTATVEGGTVVKYGPSSNSLSSWTGITADAFVYQTSPYCPAVFTAMDDDSMGEGIDGSSGTPAGTYAVTALADNSDDVPKCIRIAYAETAYWYSGYDGENFAAADVQILNCSTGFYLEGDGGQSIQLENGLISDVDTVVDGDDWDWDGDTNLIENVTFVNCETLTIDGGYVGVDFFNCILANVTNLTETSDPIGNNNGFYNCMPFGTLQFTNTVWPFQTAGGGSYYLAADSSYRNAGTTNIDPELLTSLATKTTWPPVIYSNTDFAGGTYPPQALRDTNSSPDLGYHYDPLDYCFSGANVSSSLLFPAGTAVGYFELPDSGENGYGIGTPNSCTITYAGTLAAPCVQAKYSTVQEGNGNWLNPEAPEGTFGGVASLGSAAHDPPLDTIINAQFTLFATLTDESGVGGAWTSDIIFRFTDCVLNSGRANSYDVDLCFTNCLFVGTWVGAYDFGSTSSSIFLQNCTMHEGQLFAGHFGGSTWPINIQNSVFENVDFSNLTNDPADADPDFCYYDYNAFVTNQSRLSVYGAHDVIVTNFNWQVGPLGDFYQTNDSPLINVGSTTADQVGLYHYTVRSDLVDGLEVKETNSIVDIGYHYVATDAYGNPLDSNGDGIPDYFEDANGDGIFNAGDLGDWKISPYGLNEANLIQVFTPLK